MPPLRNRKPSHIAFAGLTAEGHKRALANAFEIAKKTRQAAADATMLALSERITPQKANEMLALISNEGLAGLMAQQPALATDIMQAVRRG